MKLLSTLIFSFSALFFYAHATGPAYAPATASAGPANASQNTASNVAQACRLSPYKDLCISALGGDPKNHNANMKDLAVKALQHASQVALETNLYIKEEMKKPDLEPMVEQYLDDCSDHYLDAGEQLDDSMAALLANAYNDVKSWVNAAIVDANACADEFKNEPKAEELKAKNDKFLQVCHNALSVTKVLESGGK